MSYSVELIPDAIDDLEKISVPSRERIYEK